MPMPRIIAATKRQQRPFRWWDFENHVIEIVSGAEQPKLATSGFPSGVHINQDGDDFRVRVSVDFAIFFAATAAHRDHVGPIRQVDAELFLERLAKLVAAHFLDQLSKCRAVSNLTKRKAAGSIYFGIIVMYRRA